MDDSTLRKYLTEDFAKARKFYDDHAIAAKRGYRILSIYLIVASAILTPIAALAPDQICWRIIAAGLSATLVVCTGLLSHLKFHENWLSYRASWDALERERRLYETGVGPYATPQDRAALFIERTEALLAKEGVEFYARHRSNNHGRGPEPESRMSDTC